MKLAIRCAGFGFLFATVAAVLAVGCGKKETDPSDPNFKQNAMKIKPGVSSGAPGGGGSANNKPGGATGAGASTSE